MDIDVSLVSSGHDIGDARLHRLASALVGQGLHVEVMATGSQSFAPSDVVNVVTAPRGAMVQRIRRAIFWPWAAKGKVVIVIDPDAVPSAWFLRLKGTIVVADVHEDYERLLKDRAWASGVVGVLATFLMRAITRLSAHVDVTVVADAHVPPMRARERLVLKNTPYSLHLPAMSEPSDTPRALYVGDLRRSRGLFDMLDLVEALPNWRLDLVGPVAPADETEFQQRIHSQLLHGRVLWHGRQPPQQAWTHAQGAWVGLSLLHDTPAFRDAIPSKIYEFISCGLPVIVSALPRQADLVSRTGAGVVVNSLSEAMQALSRYEVQPELLANHRLAASGASFLDDRPYQEFARRIARLAGKP